MRRKAYKLRIDIDNSGQFPLGGAKINSTCIGTFLETYFVVGDSHNNIRLYTFDCNQEIECYSNPNPSNQQVQTEITAVALSCTEKEIFSGTNRGIINLWDTDTAKAYASLKGHSTAVNCFGIYPEEPSRIASGSYDTTIKIWDIREKNCTATLKGHSKPINSIAISPDGNMLLSGSEDSTARLWQMRMPQKPIYVASEHSAPILKVKFNPEDCMFATCSMDKTAKYFRCEDKCLGFASSTDMIATPVTGIGFSEDGKTLFTAANDVLKSWNMYKNGVLLETFEAGWKGVQDISMIKGSLMGVAFSGGSLSLWCCDLQRKVRNNSQLEEGSFVLPKINKNPNRIGDDSQVREIQNLVGRAVENVNNIEDRPTRDVERKKEQIDKRKEQMERRREEIEKKREEQQKKMRELMIEREKERERVLQQKLAKEKEEKERKQLEKQKKLEEDRLLKERLYQQRLEREKQMQEKVKFTLEQNQNERLEATMDHDVLDNSSMMNLSAFVADGAQKDKLRQVELIGQLMKESSKFESVLRDRSNAIKPIINFWKQGRIPTALDLLQKCNPAVLVDCANTILSLPIYKSAITPEVGIVLSSSLRDLMVTGKHSTYVAAAMNNINLIVLLFKDELIKIKTFTAMTRVDITRQERLAKYDKLIDEFLSIFKQDRLKKYYERKRAGESEEINQAAYDLYKNLEEVLIKIMPKKEPEMA